MGALVCFTKHFWYGDRQLEINMVPQKTFFFHKHKLTPVLKTQTRCTILSESLSVILAMLFCCCCCCFFFYRNCTEIWELQSIKKEKKTTKNSKKVWDNVKIYFHWLLIPIKKHSENQPAWPYLHIKIRCGLFYSVQGSCQREGQWFPSSCP